MLVIVVVNTLSPLNVTMLIFKAIVAPLCDVNPLMTCRSTPHIRASPMGARQRPFEGPLGHCR